MRVTLDFDPDNAADLAKLEFLSEALGGTAVRRSPSNPFAENSLEGASNEGPKDSTDGPKKPFG